MSFTVVIATNLDENAQHSLLSIIFSHTWAELADNSNTVGARNNYSLKYLNDKYDAMFDSEAFIARGCFLVAETG